MRVSYCLQLVSLLDLILLPDTERESIAEEKFDICAYSKYKYLSAEQCCS
jgi:hypothetical protein